MVLYMNTCTPVHKIFFTNYDYNYDICAYLNTSIVL